MAKAKIGTIEIEYEEFGSPQDPAIVLISGLGVQLLRWPEAFCRRFVDQGLRVIRYDNRDIGLSTSFEDCGPVDFSTLAQALAQGKTPQVAYSLLDMVQDLHGLLDSLSISSAHIAGRSMGGMIAQVFASLHPERVRSLTVIMSGTGNLSLPQSDPRAMEAMMRPSPNPAVDEEGYLRHAARFAQIIGSPAYPTSSEAVREQTRLEVRRSYRPTSLCRQIAALAVTGDIRKYSKSITAPTTVIHGRNDLLIPVECGIDVAANISGARLEIVEGMGHDFPEQLYPRFEELIIGSVASGELQLSLKNFAE